MWTLHFLLGGNCKHPGQSAEDDCWYLLFCIPVITMASASAVTLSAHLPGINMLALPLCHSAWRSRPSSERSPFNASFTRRSFIDYASKFELTKPNNVVFPDETRFPVPLLPVQNGLVRSFANCAHLCVKHHAYEAAPEICTPHHRLRWQRFLGTSASADFLPRECPSVLY